MAIIGDKGETSVNTGKTGLVRATFLPEGDTCSVKWIKWKPRKQSMVSYENLGR